MSFFSEVLPFIIVTALLVYGIVSTIRKAKHNKNNQEKKASAVKKPIPSTGFDTQNIGSDSAEDEFDKAQARRNANKKSKKNKIDNPYSTRNQITAVDDTDAVNTVKKQKPQSTDEKKHIHPAEKTSNGKKVKKPSIVGSLGELNDEGCPAHNDISYIIDEVKTGDSSADPETAELQRLIVWGEILNSPKFKRTK